MLEEGLCTAHPRSDRQVGQRPPPDRSAWSRGYGARRGGKAASQEEAARPDGSPHTPPLRVGRATDRLRRAPCSGTRLVPQPFLLRRAGRPRLGEEALSEPRPPGPVLRSGGLLPRAGRRGPGSGLRRHVLVCMRKRRSRAQLAPGAGDRALSARRVPGRSRAPGAPRLLPLPTRVARLLPAPRPGPAAFLVPPPHTSSQSGGSSAPRSRAPSP